MIRFYAYKLYFYFHLLIFLIIAFTSCKPVDENIESDIDAPFYLEKIQTWSIERSEIIQTPSHFGKLSDGSMVILDMIKQTINHFDADGNLISSFGGKGRGPGEYDQIADVAIHPDGKVAVVDSGSPQIRIISVYSDRYITADLDMGWNTRVHWVGNDLIITNSPFRFSSTNSGGIVMRTFNTGDLTNHEFMYLELDDDNQKEEQISCTFCQFRFSDDLSFFTTTKDLDYAIFRVNPHTGEKTVFKREGLQPLKFTEAERKKIDEVRDWVMKMSGVQLDNFMTPGQRNLIQDFFPDHKGRLWVIRNVKYGNTEQFDIFSADAEYIGSLDVPKRAESVQYVKEGKLLVKYYADDPDRWEAGLYKIVEIPE
jgi:hypothetical protein